MIGAIGAELLGAAALSATGLSRSSGIAVGEARKTDGARSPSGENGSSAGRSSGAGRANAAQGVSNAAGAAGQAQNGAAAEQTKAGRFDRNDCQSCKNRTYQDGSGDPGVSFKAPTKISADQAASAVMGHEMEHVNRNKAKASAEGREVVSQSVVLHNAICAECGRSYVAGGETRTVTANKRSADSFNVGKSAQEQPGQTLNAVA